MRYRVGSTTYRVRLVSGWIHHEGRRCFGLCDHETQELFISDRVPTAERARVVAHELVHAWAYHMPPPIREEHMADWLGTIAGSMVEDMLGNIGLELMASERPEPARAGSKPAA